MLWTFLHFIFVDQELDSYILVRQLLKKYRDALFKPRLAVALLSVFAFLNCLLHLSLKEVLQKSIAPSHQVIIHSLQGKPDVVLKFDLLL